MRKIMWVIVLLFFWIRGYSTLYYFSNSGLTTNTGLSPASPWPFSKLNFAFLPDDQILFNKGETFVGTITVSRNGTAGHPIIYSSYGSGAQPIITGFQTVSSWSNLGANIWESTTPISTLSQLNMVLMGGVNTAMGRFPQTGYMNIAASPAPSITTLSSSSLNSAVTNWTGAEVVIRKVAWITDRNLITSASGQTINFVASADGFPAQPPPATGGSWGCFIENDVRTLAYQNAWYYNPATKKIRVYSASQPTNVQVSTVDTLCTIQNRHDVTIDGITFTGANHFGFAISSSNITIQNCTIDYSGTYGVWGGQNNATSTGFIFQNNTINHSNNNGILLRSNFTAAIVQSNLVKNTGLLEGMLDRISTSNQYGLGVQLRADNIMCQFNEVDSSGYIGIGFFGNNITVQYNFVNGALLTLSDGGLIYTFIGFAADHITPNPPTTGCKVLHNICLNAIGVNAGTPNTGLPQAQGIYMDDCTGNVEVAYNTVAASGNSGIFLHNTVNMNVHDNTLFNCGNGIVFDCTANLRRIRSTTLKNNILVGRTATPLPAQNAANPRTLFDQADLRLFGSASSIDSNAYAVPIDDNLTFLIKQGAPVPASFTDQSLAQWQVYSLFDTHSTKSPFAITNVNQFYFDYNATNAPVVKTLPAGSWKDMRNTSYAISTTLQPYASVVLINSGATGTPPTANAGLNQLITIPTNSVTLAGSGSDPDGVIVAYAWTQVSGGSATIVNPNSQNTSVTGLSAGTYIFRLTVTDNSGLTGTDDIQVTVNQGSATLAFTNLTQSYDGLPKPVTVTTTPAGLTVVSILYNGVGAAPTNVGTYTVTAGLTNNDWTAPTITNTLTINKGTATISLGNLNQVYDGSPKPITVTTTPGGLSGISITYNGSATAPTAAGSYPIVVSLSNANWQATNATGTLVIAKATPTVSWATPGAITYPTALSGTQLNATASVAGAFTYTPASGTILNAGSQTLSVNFTPTDAANYNSVLNTTVTIVVNKGTATISLSNLAQVYDGTGKSATATTNPVGLNVVSITYNGSATLPINAGTYAVIASLSNSNYNATNATGNLVISKATATLSLSNTSQTYNGTPKSVTVTTAPAGLTVVSVTYDGSGTSPTNAGSYAVVATLSNTNYQGSISGTLAIAKATPVISWATPVSITYPTALSGTQLNATSGGVAGTFTYTPPSGTILNAGANILTVNFAPTDASNYNAVNGTTVTITVNKGTATISLSNLNQTFDGNPKPVTVSTSPVGLGVITTTYNGSGTAPSAVGSYTVNSSLSNSNYTATPATGTLVISASAASIFITNLSQTYTGSQLPVTVTTNPNGLSHTTMYNGSATVPTNAGTYTVIATINDGIHTGADTQTYVINKANPVITWSNPTPITYGTALSGVQLNASASVAGVLTYTPASGTVLNAGTQILSVGFVPTDAANYNSIPATTVTIVVNKATATLTLSNLNQVYDGTQKFVTVTSSPVGLAVISVTYNGSSTAPSAVGTYPIIASLSNSNYTATPATGNLVIGTTTAGITISNLLQTYTGLPLPATVTTNPSGLTHTDTYNGSGTVPTNVGSYTVIATLNDGTHTGADTQTLVIIKATPIVTWATPAAITFGTALSVTQLNATANIAGAFVYVPISGTIPNAGVQSLTVTFTPTDAANYNSVVKTVSITVNKATATLTLSNLTQVYNALPHPITVTTSPVGISGVTILYNGSATPPTNAGVYPVVVSLSNSNYQATTVNDTLTVTASTNYTLAWSAPTPIQQGSTITASILSATSTIAGAFSYNYPVGTIMGVPGTYILIATFTPTDQNFGVQTISVALSVYGNPFYPTFFIIDNPVYLNLPNQ